MDSTTLLSFLALDLLLVCVPGADWAYTIAAGVRGRSVPAAVGGLVSGYAVHTALAVAGLAVLVAGSPALLTALTVAGAGYLVWLGWSVLRRPGVPSGEPGGSGPGALPGESGGRVFLRGAAISGLNPKGLLLYLSVLPQFLVTGGARSGVAGAGVTCRWPRRRPSSGCCTWRAVPPCTPRSASWPARCWAPVRRRRGR